MNFEHASQAETSGSYFESEEGKSALSNLILQEKDLKEKKKELEQSMTVVMDGQAMGVKQRALQELETKLEEVRKGYRDLYEKEDAAHPVQNSQLAFDVAYRKVPGGILARAPRIFGTMVVTKEELLDVIREAYEDFGGSIDEISPLALEKEREAIEG